VKILVDMNLSLDWVVLLNPSDIPAVHWSIVGVGDTPDAEIMAWSAANGYVVLTHDLAFGAILAATRGIQPSVVQNRATEVSPTVIGDRVIAALRQAESELGTGAFLTIDADRQRLRILPLSRSK
jgi:predicted nuclease of predicted toxin-antitoxin system